MNDLVRRGLWLGLIMTAIAGLGWGWGTGLSVLLGSGMAWLNFRWMQRGVDRVLMSDPSRQSDLKIIAQYILRLLLILATLFAIIRFSFLSLGGGLVGLSIFVLAGMFEAVILLYRQLRRS